jgi:hypothetical protein
LALLGWTDSIAFGLASSLHAFERGEGITWRLRGAI